MTLGICTLNPTDMLNEKDFQTGKPKIEKAKHVALSFDEFRKEAEKLQGTTKSSKVNEESDFDRWLKEEYTVKKQEYTPSKRCYVAIRDEAKKTVTVDDFMDNLSANSAVEGMFNRGLKKENVITRTDKKELQKLAKEKWDIVIPDNVFESEQLDEAEVALLNEWSGGLHTEEKDLMRIGDIIKKSAEKGGQMDQAALGHAKKMCKLIKDGPKSVRRARATKELKLDSLWQRYQQKYGKVEIDSKEKDKLLDLISAVFFQRALDLGHKADLTDEEIHDVRGQAKAYDLGIL